MILNGSAIMIGGSISIPMDMSTDATTMSMIKNGTKIRKPISNARRSSLTINAGISTRSGHVLAHLLRRQFRHVLEQRQILIAHMSQHEIAHRDNGTLERLHFVDLTIHQWLDALVIGSLERRHHNEKGKEQGEADQNLVGRRLLHAQGGAQKRQHHHDTGERRHHDQNGRRQTENGYQHQKLDDASREVAAFAIAEVQRQGLCHCRFGHERKHRDYGKQ